jgi:hypothetical protein
MLPRVHVRGGVADHPLETYYRTLLTSLKELKTELRLVQAQGNSLFAISQIGSKVRPDRTLLSAATRTGAERC